MGKNFVKTFYLNTNVVVSSQNTTSVNSTGFDMSNYDTITGILVLSSAVGVPSTEAGTTSISFEAQESEVQSTASADGYVSLTGTNVVCADGADACLVCEVDHPKDRYVRFRINGTTAVYSALHVVRGPAQSQPVTQASTVVAEVAASPTTGTA